MKNSELICNNITTSDSSSIYSSSNSSVNSDDRRMAKYKSLSGGLRIVIPQSRESHINTNLDYEVDGDSYFKHLNFAGQSYYEHFKAAMSYSWCSLKCSFYFFCHALWPDVYQQTGSNQIIKLGDTLIEKYRNRINYLKTY